MRQTFIVSYDISDPKRLRQVYQLLRGYGDHLQLSVFQCDLSNTETIELNTRLSEIIHHQQDQVLFIDLGPADGRGRRSIRSLGRAYTHPESDVLVI